MTTEMLVTNEGCDCAVAVELSKHITELFDSGNNHLTSIKVCINPKYQKANIYAGYEDTGRLRGNGQEETMATLCEALIDWSHSESTENTKESWKDFSYPKAQMRRALLLSQELNQQFIILCYTDNLKCYIKDGEAHIDRV